ncbi:thioesterase family protein [uncultured Ramlibacter sp.]|uniref:thioesterase family protein n=1 Tax=uncultured Ramlibacter sp. TaxID=260755 RepID=UPI00260DBD9E|nr:thioesterase family protein [uncultured Ramlibacter sp.]
MSGLLRNLLTLLTAWPRYGSCAPHATVASSYRVTPLDTGITTLKSDRYLQIAESAQVDFLLNTGLMGGLLKQRIQFVNLAQMVRFGKAVRLFDKLQVDTRVAFADGKCAYFSHSFSVGGEPRAQVLVKMKFKQGRITVPPQQVLGAFSGDKPAQLQHWDDSLQAF